MERKYTPDRDGKILSINTRHYPTQSGMGCYSITTVLVGGAIEDYAAYSGNGTPEWVARHGDKISFREASCHFMGLSEENYRL